MLPALMIGSDDSTPMKRPPSNAGWYRFVAMESPQTNPRVCDALLVVVLASQMRDQLLAPHVAQGVLELHELDEHVVFGVELGRVHGAFEVERQPFLDAAEPRALRQIEKERDVEHDRRRQN